MNDTEKKYVHIINNKGASMLTMHRIGREGDKITIEGSLMGAWPSTMYMNPEEIFPLIKLALNWSVFGYFLSLPFILLKRRFKKKPKQD